MTNPHVGFRWLIVVLLTCVGVAAGAAIALLSPKVYQSSTELFISLEESTNQAELVQGDSFVQQRIRSFVDIVSSPIVLDPVIAELNLSATPEQLAAKVSASSTIDTSLLTITVTDPSAAQAATIAKATTASLANAINAVQPTRPEGNPALRVVITRPAGVPSAPQSNWMPALAAGGAGGLAVGLAAALLIGRLRRDIITTSVDLTDSTGEATLAVVPPTGRRHRKPIRLGSVDMHQSQNAAFAESFRWLRTNLMLSMGARKTTHTIVVGSVNAGGGSTTVAVNLASVLNDAGSRVCLVDANLRSPAIATALGIDGTRGLSDALTGTDGIHRFIQHLPHGLDIVAAGQTQSDPSALFATERMELVLKELRGDYDFVLLDSAPILAVTDSAVLASIVDGAILVAESGRTTRADASAAADVLSTAGASLVGTVLNRAAAGSRLAKTSR